MTSSFEVKICILSKEVDFSFEFEKLTIILGIFVK